MVVRLPPQGAEDDREVEVDWFSPAESYGFFVEDPPRTPDFADD